ncbi:putative odorant receptor 69a [Scaptodrosophila lebanonensis]|uniref:Odorant receptor n=1 Tax=Drosophila lebanonensis TaxID=7225 RepID=A0A6J2T9H0_DROLE|nr:putative odorant receptor 69a [Scaptodrosophila lebanonensis]
MQDSLQLHHFMRYPHLGCQLAMMPVYEWSGSGVPHVYCTMAERLWFLFGALNLVYQNFGMVIYLFVADRVLEQQQRSQLGVDIAQISETCSIMGLTLVGTCNMWMLLHHRGDIERLLAQLQQLYPREGQQASLYRVAHYYLKSDYLMRLTTIFFMSAYSYYNSLPILELLYELLVTSKQVQYKFQSNTWYPWPVHNSPFGFFIAYLCQALSSLVGVAFIMSGEFLLCFFITQMRLHFDAIANAFRALDASRPEANKQLKSLISLHSRLLLIADDINRIFNITFLVNFSTSTIAICLMAFSMVMISPASTCKYSVGLLSFLVFTLFICYNGNEFTTASDKLLPAAFYSNWHEGDLAFRKMLLFFMMRSCESRVLRAYKFMTVSMQTYMAILKFSYQLFTFMRAMI